MKGKNIFSAPLVSKIRKDWVIYGRDIGEEVRN